METTARLLFALSSMDRLMLLLEVEKEKMRLTQLAQSLSATVQETSRHLGRLADAKLIVKDSTRSYTLTSFGRLMLSLFPSFSFLSKNREYFLTHDASLIPPEFLYRIGDLSTYKRIEHAPAVVDYLDHVIVEAEQYIWLMADHPFRHHHLRFNPYPERLSSFRGILQSNISREEYDYVMGLSRFGAETGLLDKVKVGIAMNEKIAGVVFPDLNGRLDFSRAFIGTGPRFLKWCRDLHTYYWDKAKLASEYPQVSDSF